MKKNIMRKKHCNKVCKAYKANISDIAKRGHLTTQQIMYT